MNTYELEPVLLRIQRDPNSEIQGSSKIFQKGVSSFWSFFQKSQKSQEKRGEKSDSGLSPQLVEIQFKFYGSLKALKSLKQQDYEIKNLIRIHWAYVKINPLELEKTYSDQSLSDYINQFLYQGYVEHSEFKVTRIY